MTDIFNDNDSMEVTSSGRKSKFTWKKAFMLVVYAFALAGFGIVGAWLFQTLGFTKNKGAVDENYRYIMEVSEMKGLEGKKLSHDELNEIWMNELSKVVAFGKFYPENARLIMNAALQSNDPTLIDRMIGAASLHLKKDNEYQAFVDKSAEFFSKQPQKQNQNAIPWMATVEWQALRESIIKDTAALYKAAEITGVDARLIVACLVGEQIRLFNSNREIFKKYLGPVKVLSVQSQFSYGVNGIKDFTAQQIEANLKNPKSEFYMGKRYENILDFTTKDHANERYKRLVDYKNHLYSYIYTGCILHQTMLQWKRAGFDISDRPDILCTLFNVGFPQSHPHAKPVCGGSHITVGGKVYTFGAIGFDFFYSGELVEAFPYLREHFVLDDGKERSKDEIDAIQNSMSDCGRPERGREYKKKDSVETETKATTTTTTTTTIEATPTPKKKKEASRQEEIKAFNDAANNSDDW